MQSSPYHVETVSSVDMVSAYVNVHPMHAHTKYICTCTLHMYTCKQAHTLYTFTHVIHMHTQYTSSKQYTGTHTWHIHTHNTHNTYTYTIYVNIHSTQEHTTCSPWLASVNPKIPGNLIRMLLFLCTWLGGVMVVRTLFLDKLLKWRICRM